MNNIIGKRAPNLTISDWIQGKPTNIDKERDNVILVEVFQVNCPGCFIYGIPECIRLLNQFANNNFKILGLATAFEDFDKNTVENLKKLVYKGEVIGETQRVLSQYGKLRNGNELTYRIPFSIAMDDLHRLDTNFTESKVMDFIEANVQDFRSYDEKDRQRIIANVKQYLRAKIYTAKTFEEYELKGTPSSILIDRKGIVQDISFGATNSLEFHIEQLLKE
jgi:thiol-disulfide isomerase/thioredoxin